MGSDLVRAAVAVGLLLGLGVAGAGFLVADGFRAVRAADRYVTVKGFSEREVAANLAMWPIVFQVSGNDLAAVQERLDQAAGKVRAYLAQRQFAAEETNVSSPRLTDLHAQRFDANRPPERYLGEATVTLRSGRVDAVTLAMRDSGELIKEGVALVRSYEYQTAFLYTGLEQIKPEMIAEATKAARRAAEQFAHDAGSSVGAIRKAQQGFFSVEDRDPFSPEFKQIRVVTTVEYFLDE
jgi:hypothetical protein